MQQFNRLSECVPTVICGKPKPKPIKTRRKKLKKGKLEPLEIRPDAAGIDVAATELFVAVPPDKDSESVRSLFNHFEEVFVPMAVFAMVDHR